MTKATKMEKRKARAKGIKNSLDEKGKETLTNLGKLMGRNASPATRNVKKGPATRTAVSMKKLATKTPISERPASGTKVSMKPTKRKPKSVEITPKDIKEMKKGKFILISPDGLRYYYADIKKELETGKESWKFKRLNEEGKNLTILGVVQGRLDKGYKMFPPPGAVPKKKETKKPKRIIISPVKGEAQKKTEEFCSALGSKKPVFTYGLKAKERNLFADLPAYTKEIQKQWKGMTAAEKAEFKKKLAIYFSAAGSGKVGVKTLSNLIYLTMKKNRNLKNVWTALEETRSWRVVGAQWKRAYIYNKILKEYKEAPKPAVEKKEVEKKLKVEEEKEEKKPEKKKLPSVDTISGAAPIVEKKKKPEPAKKRKLGSDQKAVIELELSLKKKKIDRNEIKKTLKGIQNKGWENSYYMKRLAFSLHREMHKDLPFVKVPVDVISDYMDFREGKFKPEAGEEAREPVEKKKRKKIEEVESTYEEAEPVSGDERFHLSEGVA